MNETSRKLMTFTMANMHPGLKEFLKYAGMPDTATDFRIVGEGSRPIEVQFVCSVEAMKGPGG